MLSEKLFIALAKEYLAIPAGRIHRFIDDIEARTTVLVAVISRNLLHSSDLPKADEKLKALVKDIEGSILSTDLHRMQFITAIAAYLALPQLVPLPPRPASYSLPPFSQ